MYYRKPTTNYDEAGPERDEAMARGARDDRRPTVWWPTFPGGTGPPTHFNAQYQQDFPSMGQNARHPFVQSRNSTFSYSWERQSDPPNLIDTYAADEYNMIRPQEERVQSDDDEERRRRPNTPSPEFSPEEMSRRQNAPSPEYSPPPQQSAQSNGNSKTRRQKRRENARMHQRENAMATSGDATVAHSSANRPMPSASHGAPPKRPKVAEPAGEKFAIIPENFPVEKILLSHVGPIQEVVITRLVDAPDPLPKITFGHIVGGVLNVHCSGSDSIAWLSSVIGEGEIAGLRFKVVETKYLPKPIKMAWKTKITGIQDSRVLLKLLQRCNPSLHTEEWKVIDTSTSETTTRLIILMDRMSADFIREAGYALHSGIDVSTFKLLEDTERARGADDRSVVQDSRDAPGD